MANYLYKTAVYTSTSNVAELPANNATNLSEYENNHQSSTIKVDGIEIAETTFATDVDYSTFDGYITSPYDWGDVKELELNNRYELYLITSEPV